MKKYWIIISVSLVTIISLLIALFVVSNKEGDTTPPTWDQKETHYITGYTSIGTIESKVSQEAKALLDQMKYEVYIFENKDKSKLLIESGDILQPGDMFFEGESTVNNFLGRVEEIVENNTIIKIYVSNFQCLMCMVDIEQIYATEVEVGQQARITFNNTVLEGQVRYKDYIINEKGTLDIVVEINNSNNIIIPNSLVTVDIITFQKSNVLLIPREALILSQETYFVDILQDDNKVVRKEVEIGIVGEEYIEIKKGLREGMVVVINRYE